MSEDSTILEKIRKLFRLAGNNSSEAEAASALAKAQKLMLEHNIQHIGDEAPDPGMEPIRGQTQAQFDLKWHSFLATAVSLLYNCRHTTNGHGQIAFWGRRDNVSAAEESLVFMATQIECLYKLTLRTFNGTLSKAQRADLRASFKGAAALRVNQRVKEIMATLNNTIPDHKALVVVNTTKAEIDELWTQAGVGKRRGRGLNYKMGLGTGAGFAAGDAVRLQREVKS